MRPSTPNSNPAVAARLARPQTGGRLAGWRRWALVSWAALAGVAGCGGPGGGYGTQAGNYTLQRTYHPAGRGPYAPLPTTILNPEQAPAVLHDPKLVRVHLFGGREVFDLAVTGGLEIRDSAGVLLDTFERLAPQPVTLTGTSLAIGNRIFYGVDRLKLQLRAGAHCQIDDEDLGTALRELTIYRNPGERKLHCVASWGVEDYLYGVLAGEVPVDWPAEALKAQAVASRTYVLYQMQDRRYEEFDVERTVSSQVFKTGDRKQIDTRVVAAVDATRGEYLTSAGELFPTYFHSTCGGETAAATEVFGSEAAPALAGHCPETACAESSVYRWIRSFPLSEFESRLVKKGLWETKSGGAIKNILPTGAQVYGRPLRATRFEIIGEKARKFVPANDFRLAFGGGRKDLPSTLIAHWEVRKGVVTIDGQGWGHGVGMCQFGAMGRAKAGAGYRTILQFYYRGAKLCESSGAELADNGSIEALLAARTP